VSSLQTCYETNEGILLRKTRAENPIQFLAPGNSILVFELVVLGHRRFTKSSEEDAELQIKLSARTVCSREEELISWFDEAG